MWRQAGKTGLGPIVKTKGNTPHPSREYQKKKNKIAKVRVKKKTKKKTKCPAQKKRRIAPKTGGGGGGGEVPKFLTQQGVCATRSKKQEAKKLPSNKVFLGNRKDQKNTHGPGNLRKGGTQILFSKKKGD